MALSDPFIEKRVRQYLEENTHQTYVDVTIMAKALQDKYEEYSKRKPAAFRASVEQAYKQVLHSYGLDSNPSDEEENTSDVEVMEAPINSNHMNQMLQNLYAKTGNNNTKEPVNSNEFIDISSDESSDEGGTSNVTTNVSQSQQQNTTKHQNITNHQKQIPQSPKPSNIADVTIVRVHDNQTNIPASNDKRNMKELNVIPPKKRKTNQEESEKLIVNKVLVSKSSSQKIVNSPTANPSVANNNESTKTLKTKRFKKEVEVKNSVTTFRHLGGLDKVLKDLCELLFHVKHPQIYGMIGLTPPRGILLHGPPGCGKTLLAHAIAGQLQIGIIEVPATELIAGVSGESEERIREIFEQAIYVSPCVLFIDDIDAISSNRMNAQRDMERRIVSQLISSLDNLSYHSQGLQIIVIGATTRPEVLDPALRRVGRFDHEIALGVPDRKQRQEILSTICDTLSLEMPFDYGKIAELTPGYVGADLLALATRAASIAVKKRYMEKMQSLRQDVIPVVDLLDDIGKESIINNTGKAKENNEEIALKPNENCVVIVEEQNKNTQLNGNVNEKEKENEIVIDTGNEEKNKTDDNNQEENKIDKVDDKMDVDEINENKSDKNEDTNVVVNEVSASNVLPETELTETKTTNNEPIDVDDLSDESFNPIGTKTKSPNTIEKLMLNKNSKCDLSLPEMINWLTSDSLQFDHNEFDDIFITMNDFMDALKIVQPSSKREGFITVPDVTWDDIGSLRDIREELKLAILAPVKYPERMKTLGLNVPSGVLLCGPPGCGKTLLAKAIANEAGINFISVKGPELMNMYVGESERAVRTCFQRARNSSPCVIFFDEFDSLCPKRSDSGEGGSGTRVVNQLLTEMDGMEERKGVYLMAATNRPDIIDPAILRPGRLDTILFVGLPEQNDRVEILNALTKNRTKPALEDDVDLVNIASQTDGFTGADLAGLVRQAALLSLKDSLLISTVDNTENLKVTNKHFEDAIKLSKPSVSVEERKLYDKLKTKYAAPREKIAI